ncbi:MAG TPA: zf-HC2 domain-containing protein [Humisphaera sp.]
MATLQYDRRLAGQGRRFTEDPVTAGSRSNPECEFGPLVSALHDGELPADRAREVAAHAASCPACAAELAGLRRFTAAFRAADRPAPPVTADELVARVRADLAAGADADVEADLDGVPQDEPVTQDDAADRLRIAPPARRPGHLRLVRWLTAAAAAVCLVATGRVVYEKLSVPANPGVGPSPTVQVGGPGTDPSTVDHRPARPAPSDRPAPPPTNR